MDIIKVSAIDSTNTFLKDRNRDQQIVAPICVVAHEQYAGKGQRGETWQSNAGENLTCSVFMPIDTIEILDQFYISMTVSLAVYDTLKVCKIPRLSIKWPNDILSDAYKICGILIENVLNGGRLQGAIIGIGININQLKFDNLPLASSMKKLSGNHYNIDEVIHVLLSKLEHRFSNMHRVNYAKIKTEYESLLFRKNKPSTFVDTANVSFVGIIQSVTASGKLQILIEDQKIRDFDLKEIKLRY